MTLPMTGCKFVMNIEQKVVEINVFIFALTADEGKIKIL